MTIAFQPHNEQYALTQLLRAWDIPQNGYIIVPKNLPLPTHMNPGVNYYLNFILSEKSDQYTLYTKIPPKTLFKMPQGINEEIENYCLSIGEKSDSIQYLMSRLYIGLLLKKYESQLKKAFGWKVARQDYCLFQTFTDLSVEETIRFLNYSSDEFKRILFACKITF